MTPLVHLVVAGFGFLALAASLLLKKRAGWFALTGTGILLGLAFDDRDPVLGLGGLALLLVYLLRQRQGERLEQGQGAGTRPPSVTGPNQVP